MPGGRRLHFRWLGRRGATILEGFGMVRSASVGKVLIIDDDDDIAEVVRALLTDEGFLVSTLKDGTEEAVRVAVNRLEPDCVLLDGKTPGGYGHAWTDAAWLSQRARRVPVLMFTAGTLAADEARANVSERAVAAGFAGILSKPFDLDELVEAVIRAAGLSIPFDTSAEAESTRTATMVARARDLGARDIHPSSRREWISFLTADGTLVQVYYWQRDGVYYALRYAESGGIAEKLGQFYDLEAALLMAITIRRGQ